MQKMRMNCKNIGDVMFKNVLLWENPLTVGQVCKFAGKNRQFKILVQNRPDTG